MGFDTTAVGIGLGVLGCGIHAILRAARKQPFDLATTVLIFLAAFSVPGGVLLVHAGFSGNHNDLPSSWREHIAVAGVATLGLSVQYLAQEFRNAWWPKTGDRAKSDDVTGPASGSSPRTGAG